MGEDLEDTVEEAIIVQVVGEAENSMLKVFLVVLQYLLEEVWLGCKWVFALWAGGHARIDIRIFEKVGNIAGC